MYRKNKRYHKNFLSKSQKNKIIHYTFSISAIITSILGFLVGIVILPYYNSLILKVLIVFLLTLGGCLCGLFIPFVIFLLLTCISKIVNFIRDCIN